jgi:predicted HAD superfamily Cof-like phosphohydrolase
MSNAFVLEAISGWFKRALPKPEPKTQQVQLAVHLEEVAEMVETFHAHDKISEFHVIHTLSHLRLLSQHLKKANPGSVTIKDPIGLLDALCDQVVTAVGVAHAEGHDFQGALAQVNDSNWSKFVNDEAIFDGDKKIAKGPGYFRPNLTPFIKRPLH